MTDRHSLVAFLTVIVAIVTLVVIGAYMASQGKSAEALGIGGAVTGLIGIAGTFKPKTNGVVQNVEQAKNVNAEGTDQ